MGNFPLIPIIPWIYNYIEMELIMKTLFQRFVDFDLDNLQEHKKWLKERKYDFKRVSNILKAQDDKTAEAIIKLIFKEFFKGDLLDDKMSWKESLLRNQEEMKSLDIDGMDYTLLNSQKHKNLVEAYRRLPFYKKSESYVFDLDTGQYVLFKDVEEKYNKILKDALANDSMEVRRRYERYQPKDEADQPSRFILGIEYVYHFKSRSWELKHKNKLDMNTACTMNITQKEKEECARQYRECFENGIETYYGKIFEAFNNSFNLFYLDALFWIKIINKKLSIKDEYKRWNYIDKFDVYMSAARELNSQYTEYKKKMSNVPIYSYIANGLKVEKERNLDYIVVPDFLSELQVFIFFNTNIHQLFRRNKETNIKPFLLRTHKENLHIASSLLKDSKDKDISFFLYESLFGTNICLCLTYYERQFRNKFDFKDMEKEYYDVARQFLNLPNICTRTILVEAILEPLLSIYDNNVKMVKEKLVDIKKEMKGLILKECEILSSLIKGFFVCGVKAMGKKGMLQMLQNKNNIMLLDNFNEKIDELLYVKPWTELLHVNTGIIDGEILREDNKCYAKYQRRYSQIVKKCMHKNEEKSIEQAL
jgi:hypothetical protein